MFRFVGVVLVMFSFKGITSRFNRGNLYIFALVIAGFSLSGCDLAANYTKTDRASNMEFQDFRDGLAERLPEVEDESKDKGVAGSIPDLQPYVSLTPSSMKSMPLVSVSVNQSVPLRDILYELAEQAEYDIEIDPNIRGAIIFTARNKPFDVVVKRISDMAGLRYKFEDGFLRVELDTPYVKTYKIDYLSFIRSNAGSVNTTVSVASTQGSKTGGAKAGSSYEAASESSSDFWGEVEANLSQILGGASTDGLRTKKDPRITAADENPDIAAVAPDSDGEGVNIQPPDAVLKVESLPIDEDDDGGSSNKPDDDDNGMSYSINKQAGLINVKATEKIHKKIAKYLDVLRRSVSSQVLVEAKVFEVVLKDEYINGIDWQLIKKELVGGFLTASGADFLNAVSSQARQDTVNGVPLVGAAGLTSIPTGSVANSSNFVTGIVGNDFQALIRAVSGFGTVRALASPRLTVLNNQSAVLNVATNRVFFELDINKTEATATAPASFQLDSEAKSIPEGVLINVQPSINLDDRTISMFLRPSVTRIVGSVQDPAVQFIAGASGIVSEIPELNVQEIDTVVKVDSGMPIVMGGLLQDRIASTNEGVPIVGEVPIFGNLFKKKSDLVSKTELVIFLKATILDAPGDSIHNTDKDLYKAFSGDRRPFRM